jgi:peptidyl-prolyl cis-trans isomerase A (cyclophilin A)
MLSNAFRCAALDPLPVICGPCRRLAHCAMLLASRAFAALFVGVLTFAASAAACGDRQGASRDAPSGPAPDTFRVSFETSRGSFVVEGIRAWAPDGADRFHALAASGFFDENRFFRVIPGYIAQFGINDDKKINERWENQPLGDDPRKVSNTRGTLVFTSNGPGTRSHQVFINLKDNPKLDDQGFVPVGRIVSGMEVVDSLYDDYGDTPRQQLISTLGNNYLLRMFPKLDYIRTAKVVPGSAQSR